MHSPKDGDRGNVVVAGTNEKSADGAGATVSDFRRGGSSHDSRPNAMYVMINHRAAHGPNCFVFLINLTSLKSRPFVCFVNSEWNSEIDRKICDSITTIMFSKLLIQLIQNKGEDAGESSHSCCLVPRAQILNSQHSTSIVINLC
jgi:hypothetical protein